MMSSHYVISPNGEVTEEDAGSTEPPHDTSCLENRAPMNNPLSPADAPQTFINIRCKTRNGLLLRMSQEGITVKCQRCHSEHLLSWEEIERQRAAVLAGQVREVACIRIA